MRIQSAKIQTIQNPLSIVRAEAAIIAAARLAILILALLLLIIFIESGPPY